MAQYELVSILIPAYRADFFETALLSALHQDWPNIEIIVCDDSDNDSIRFLCESHAKQSDIPILYNKNEQRLLEKGNVLRCLGLSQGKYIKFLYDDDTLNINCVSRLVAALEHSPDIILSSSRRTRIDEKGEVLPDIPATAFPFNQDVVMSGEDIISFLCDHQVNFIGEPSVFLCYREDLVSLGDQIFSIENEEMYYFADVAVMIKLLRKGNLAFISESLSSFRISAGQTSQMAAGQQEKVARTYSLMPQLIKQLGWYKGNKEENQFVRVSPMNRPDVVLKENLLQALLNSRQHSFMQYQSNQFNQWLAKRHLSSQYEPIVANWHQMRDIQATLIVIILQKGCEPTARQSSTTTLSSLLAWQGYGLTIKPVLVAENPTGHGSDVQTIVAADSDRVAAINRYLADCGADWVMIVEAGETVQPSGMLMFDLALGDTATCDAIYGDAFYQREGQILGTALRPDFNLDMLLSYPAEMARHWIFRLETLIAQGGFNTRYQQAWQFEYIVRLIEQKGTAFAGHLPEVFILAHPPEVITQREEVEILTQHLRNRGYPRGKVEIPMEGKYALRYEHSQQPLVSIIIPTKDQLDILIPCVTSLLEKTRYPNYEILIVDNNSETPEAQQWLAGITAIDPARIRVLPYPLPFNYSAINNMAAREARGEYLLLLNNDTEMINSVWLDNLLNHGLRPEVGITGGKLLYPDGAIQHAGVVMGLRGPASHPFNSCEPANGEYMNRLHVDQNYSVVTAACLLIRKSVYEQVGGMDEDNFTVSYNDVDLCLKVREAGYLTVWTPHSVVIHIGNVSQNNVDKTKQQQKILRLRGEQDVMYKKWRPIITHDPAYNQNLSLDGNGFEFVLDGLSTWQPLHWKPLPTLLAFPLRGRKESNLRMVHPLTMMKEAALIDAQISYHPLGYAEVARYAPTTLLVQQQITPLVQEWLSRLKVISPAFTVFDMSEYLPALAANAAAREHLPKDILKALRDTLAYVDRVIVPGEVMAEACSALHEDVRIMETRLSPALWSGLESQRGTGKKPRVGWVSQTDNNAELEIIHKVIGQMAHRVDWIFVGYCPPSLRQYVAENHIAVTPDQYPRQLASLNLDLALVPRADNAWTRPLSALPLLEFGACGIPVICSDVASFRNDFTVTRVENKAKAWRDAMETHLQDLEATWRMGDGLKAQVCQQGMWQNGMLAETLRLWLPN